ncbi:MAG: hypothetical protein JWO11_3603 [Nocardioides sp.]|nr:hypothetical protein [Nocardioides sp.]
MTKLAQDVQTAVRNAGLHAAVINSGCTIVGAEGDLRTPVRDALIAAGFDLETLTDDDWISSWTVTRTNRKATR